MKLMSEEEYTVYRGKLTILKEKWKAYCKFIDFEPSFDSQIFMNAGLFIEGNMKISMSSEHNIYLLYQHFEAFGLTLKKNVFSAHYPRKDYREQIIIHDPDWIICYHSDNLQYDHLEIDLVRP